MQDDRCDMRIGTYLCINLPPQLTCQTSHDMREEIRDFTAPRVGICRVRTRHRAFTHSHKLQVLVSVVSECEYAYCKCGIMRVHVRMKICKVACKPHLLLILQPIQSRAALQPYPTAWISNCNFGACSSLRIKRKSRTHVCRTKNLFDSQKLQAKCSVLQMFSAETSQTGRLRPGAGYCMESPRNITATQT